MLSKEHRPDTQAGVSGGTLDKQEKTISSVGLMMAYREQVIQQKVTSYIKANGSITPQDQKCIISMNTIKSNTFDNVVQLIGKSGDLFGYFGLFKPSDRVVFSLTGTYITEEQVQWAVACHCALMGDGLVLKRTKKDKLGSLCYMEFTSKKSWVTKKIGI